jgi:hypothetical protein
MYEVLHYHGDLTKVAEPGMLMGPDFGTRRIFEILDAEYDAEQDRTTVNLRTPPSYEAMQAAGI